MQRKANKVKLDKLPIRQTQSPKNNNSDEKGKEPLKVTYKWVSPSRIWRPKTKLWYLTSAATVLAVMLFAVLSRYPAYPWLILMLIAFLVLWYVHGTIPPMDMEHKLTNKGIFAYGILYPWEEIAFFWFAQKENNYLLYVQFPKYIREPKMQIIIDKQEMQTVFDLLIRHIKYAGPAEAEVNFLSQFLQGDYLPISRFIPDLDKAD